MKVWATRRAIIEEIADLPRNWLDAFASNRPYDVRKLADAQNGKLLYRVSAVLDALESCEFFRTADKK